MLPRLKEDLWRKTSAADHASSLLALVALAAYDPDSPRWKKIGETALNDMLNANPLHLGQWVVALRPVRIHLLASLERVFRGEELAEYRQVATSILADYADDRPQMLAELLLDADTRQYAMLIPVLLKHRTEAIAQLRKAQSARPDYWNDPPVDANWQKPAPVLVREIEQAGGIFAERFILCQTLPLTRVLAVTEGLRRAGYRPVKVRPWSSRSTGVSPVKNDTGETPVLREAVAIVWTRDNVPWTLQTNLTAQQAKVVPAGMIVADVAGYATKDGDRYAVLWRKPDTGEQTVLYVDVPEADHKSKTESLKKDGFIAATVQAMTGDFGMASYNGVWWKGPDKPEGWHVWWAETEATYSDRVFSAERLLLDVHVGPAFPSIRQMAWTAGLIAAPGSLAALALPVAFSEILPQTGVTRQYASVWHDDTMHEAVGLHGLSAAAHLARCRDLAAQGYRPIGLSLAALPGARSPLAASGWHRPVPPAAEKERLASRQATAAAAMLYLKEPEDVWTLLRHSPDPTVRSYLVERMSSRGVDPRLLVERLEVEKDVSARRSLILALGDYPEKHLPAAMRGPLVKKLLAWYRNEPDAGIHGAIDWLLRHGKEGPADRPLDWGGVKELDRSDSELAKASRRVHPGAPDGGDKPRRSPGWYVNSRGQTFTLIPGPVEFRMGSPLWEPDRNPVTEKPHRRAIPRSFAIATKPITVAQWQHFLNDRPDVPRDLETLPNPDPAAPITQVSWFLAARYCNWLSEKEGIPREEWCYPEDVKEGMKPHPDYLGRNGYRLPTEAEWEYACRADTTTSRYYGSPNELLPRHAFFQFNSDGLSWPVGQKRPNDLGLFDMHGNVWTWCQDAAGAYASGRVEDKEDSRDLSGSSRRIIRGGSYAHPVANLRAAVRARQSACGGQHRRRSARCPDVPLATSECGTWPRASMCGRLTTGHYRGMWRGESRHVGWSKARAARQFPPDPPGGGHRLPARLRSGGDAGGDD